MEDALQTALENTILIYALLMAFPKPSYSVDGQSVSWDAYRGALLQSMAILRQQIQIQAGPFEFQTQAW